MLELLRENRKKENYQEILKSQKKNIFTCKLIPDLTIKQYLERIKRYTNVDDISILIGLIYLDRFCKKTKIILTDYNIHRLLFISILVSIKFYEDDILKNNYYSKVCGVKIKILNKMEYEFVCGIGFELYVSDAIFKKYRIIIQGD